MSVATVLVRHRSALELFTDRLRAVSPDQWHSPTPCTDWSVRDLVGHLTAEQLWVVPLVRDGRDATDADAARAADGDVLGPEPLSAWQRAAGEAGEMFREPGALERTVNLSYGRVSCRHYCAEMTVDLVVHAWDLARAIGAEEQLPGELVEFALGEVTPRAGELSGSGLFAPPVALPQDSSRQDKLLALLGREP